MRLKKALAVAREVVGDEATVSAHRGANPRRDQGVRVTGCYPETARRVGAKVAARLGGSLRCDAGFVCVWL
jgi:hypothetical protein